MSENSIVAYKRDIDAFFNYLEKKGIKTFSLVNDTLVVTYIMQLKSEKKATSTINRSVSSIRLFCDFLMGVDILKSNPVKDLKTPKIEKKLPTYLSLEEVELLISLPDDSVKGKRDKAIIEILYATGIRVSELVDMEVNDVNVKLGFVACNGEHGRARIIPLGKHAKEALSEYLKNSRPKLLKEKMSQALFLNFNGVKMTRQGLWKIIKGYASLGKIEKEITPQIVRHSFAVHLVQNGADLKSLQDLLGHVDISTTQIYAEVSKNKIKEVYDKAHPRA